MSGLDSAASEQLLVSRGLSSNSHHEALLTERYSGNPLALKLVADTVQDLFFGDIQEFLAEDSLIFDDVRHMLDQQFERATQLEQEILLWLAVARQSLSVADIRENLLRQPPQRNLLEALHRLQRRSLIERGEVGFGLQNVITEYLTDVLIDHAYREIVSETPSETPDLLNRHALLLARSVEYVRQSQSRLILQPLGKRLLDFFGSSAALLEIVRGKIDLVRNEPNEPCGYAAGNFLNLLLALEVDVQVCDFSGLCIRQAFLQGARLGGVNFDGADFVDAVFNDAFGVVQALALHPDGNTLAIASLNEGVRLWRLDEWQLQAILSNDGIRVASITFSPDGSTIVGASDDNTVRIWQTDSGKLLRSLTGHTDALWSVAVAPDGEHIASTSDDNTVRLWHAQTGQLLATIVQHKDVPKAVAFSPDGEMLASTGSDNTARLWHIPTQQEQAVMHSPTELSTALAFSPDGETLATGDSDGKIVLWDVRTTEMRQTLTGHTGWVNDIAFAPDGRWLASTCNDQTVRLWDAQSGETRQILPHPSWVWDVAFSADGSRIVTSCNNLVALWNAQTGYLQNTLNGHSGYAKSLVFSRDGSILAAAIADGTVHRWRTDVAPPHYLPNTGKLSWVDFVALHPDAQTIATNSNDKDIILIQDASSRLSQRTMQEYKGRGQAGAFSDDGQRLVTATTDRTLLLWDTQSGQLLDSHHIAGENQFVYQIAISPDASMVAVAGADHLAHVWQPQSKHVVKLAGHSKDVYGVAFHPDGQTLATCSSDRTVRLWDLSSLHGDRQASDTGQSNLYRSNLCLSILESHTTWVWSLAFSPNSTILASGSEDGTIILWDLPSGTVRHTLKAHTGWVPAFAFSPDGRIVASSGGDDTIKFWDVENGRCLHKLPVPGPYAGMNITRATGITDAQKAALKALGAVEK